MGSDYFSSFLPVVCAGLGLLIVGSLNLLLLRRGFVVRATATAFAFGVAVLGAFALEQPGVTVKTAEIMAIGLLPCLLLSSRRLVTGLAGFVSSLQKPPVRFGLLTIAGVGVIVGSIVVFDKQDEKAASETLNDLESFSKRTTTIDIEQQKAWTDHGTQIVLKEPSLVRDGPDLSSSEQKLLQSVNSNDQLIRRGPASDRTNCHGWVFTGGRFILSPDDVELILKENGYEEIQEPHPGDVIIYRRAGVIAHSGVIRYVTEGQPVLIESKWGALGLFLHPADKAIYGSEYTFHRSHRSGHLLAGVGGPTPVPGTGTGTGTANRPATATE
jgi:hypothetical protein